MRVLVACEYSGTVRDAFRARGHDAMSRDLLPTDVPGPHYEGPVEDLMGEEWDLVIAHPPCTFLANSGSRHLYSEPKRWQDMLYGADFFRKMFQFKTPRLCVENPIQHRWARLAHGQGGATQVVQPWMFGHPESKATCLWLRGLPPLVETSNVKEEFLSLPKAKQQRLNYLPPSKDRWKLRSATFPGIAAAMAEQWG